MKIELFEETDTKDMSRGELEDLIEKDEKSRTFFKGFAVGILIMLFITIIISAGAYENGRKDGNAKSTETYQTR